MGLRAEYRWLARLGSCGSGVIDLAEQQRPPRRRVAIKPVEDSAERDVLALFDHQNVVRGLECGVDADGRRVLVMEHVDGDPITAACDRGRWSVRSRIALFMQACAALDHVHRRGIVHRDVKPSNLLVSATSDGPCVKLIDFGIAARVGAAGDAAASRGTPGYVSPEQACGGAADPRADVYSLGAVLYELLVGTTPFDPVVLAESGVAELRRTLTGVDPSPLAERFAHLGPVKHEVARRRSSSRRGLARFLRGDIDGVVRTALAREPARRHATPADLAADVRGAIGASRFGWAAWRRRAPA